MGSQRDEYRRIVKAALAAGWRVREGTNHTVLYPADKTKPPVTVARSQSTGRKAYQTDRRLKAQLRRSGLELD